MLGTRTHSMTNEVDFYVSLLREQNEGKQHNEYRDKEEIMDYALYKTRYFPNWKIIQLCCITFEFSNVS